jgi:hypothetical protein
LNYLLDLREHIPVEIYILLPIVLIKVLLKVLEGQLIAILKFAIVVTLLLDGVISQVDVLVVQVARVVLLARGTNITVIIVVTLLDTVDRGP